MKRWLSLLVVVLAISIVKPAMGQEFDQLVVFGDSTVDSGFFKALSSPGANAAFNAAWTTAVADGAGKPTNSPGLMSSELLALYLGLSAQPSNQGGTNYATSGAKNVTVNNPQAGGFQAAIPTVTQIANYLAAHAGHADPNALYLISSGGNDISFALGESGNGPYPADPNAYLVGAANSLAAAIKSLHDAGAGHFIVPNLAFSFPANDATKRAARTLYTDTLFSALADQGVSVVQADFNALLGTILANPLQFGLTSTGTGPGAVACTQPAGVTSAWALLCSSNPNAPSHLVDSIAEQASLFADDQHLATTGQRILGNYFYRLLRASPATALTLNASTFHAHQTLAYRANLAPGSTTTWVDVYVGVLAPDQATFVSFVRGFHSFLVGNAPVRFLTNTTLPEVAVGLDYTFSGAEPVGTYYTYAVLTAAGTNPFVPANWISASFQPFQFSP